MSAPLHPVICLMGPTASGKTPLAIELVQRFPCEIVSVDSAMVFREMNIGTAKPDAAVLQIAPHHLIDICDPSEIYSAGKFCRDALDSIALIQEKNKIPLLVGGTMMYFRVLQQGLAVLPKANENMRARLQARIEQEGLAALHAELMQIDVEAAKRIHPHDSQRIQRALEVFMLSGKTISAWQMENENPLSKFSVHNIALIPQERAWLHERIALRFQQMLKIGLIDEVEKLYVRGDLSPALPSIRSVGYREIWDYLAGLSNYSEMTEKAIASTRQLAKRQLTWLRSFENVMPFESNQSQLGAIVSEYLTKILKK